MVKKCQLPLNINTSKLKTFIDLRYSIRVNLEYNIAILAWTN